MRRLLATFLLVPFVALGLSACGGGDTQGSTASTQAGAPGSQEKPSEGGQAKPKPHKPETAEESVEGFGSEARGSGKEAIVAAEQQYLTAMAERDYSAACGLLARSALTSMKQIVPPKVRAKVDCAAILSKLLSSSAPVSARQQLQGKITKVRMKGDEAFIIFHAPGARLYTFTMVREAGGWKAATVIASVLSPSAATLGE